MDFLKPQVGKARKPKFELHLKIYDLNNVPLVSGQSFIKWNLAHSMNAEHRGRTAKCPIANHRVDYSFVTLVPSIRISIDRNNNLAECPIEFEVVQEFGISEKMTLGVVRLNLSEYVEESESFGKDVASPGRMRSGSIGVSPTRSATGRPRRDSDVVEDGIVRRYLMQDSKVNSTLKIGILMVQVDGERSYVAPPLKTAPVFGGIGGIMGESVEDDAGPVPSISKSRDTAELQDLYRSVLAASWCRQPSELSAEEVIEDIFSGGNGWKTKPQNTSPDTDGDDDFDDDLDHRDTLRPRDARRVTHLNVHHHHGTSPTTASSPTHAQPNHGPIGSSHRRSSSNSSDKSFSTVTVTPANRRKGVRIHELDHSRSLASMASTMSLSSDVLREVGFKGTREVREDDVRNDLVAWRMPGDPQVM
ncbi:C2 NT-type domain-containing protein [Fusarium sp. LHS14.1]|nr:C2 NT-type domain-containing protein [Fusarium sp. LHS14.1]